MLSPGNTSHPEAYVPTVQSQTLYYDGPKIPHHYSDETHTYSHRQRHHPETRLARWESAADSSHVEIDQSCIQNTEAENYRCIHNYVSLAAVLTNDGDIDAMLLSDTGEQCLHTFTASLIPLGQMSVVLVSPPDRHVFGSGGVITKMTSIGDPGQVQRMVVILGPRTTRADGMIAGPNTPGESDGSDQEKESFHNVLDIRKCEKFRLDESGNGLRPIVAISNRKNNRHKEAQH